MARSINEKVNTHLQAALDSLEREKALIDDQIRAIRSVLGQAAAAAALPKGPVTEEVSAGTEPVVRRRRRRKLSAEARARIAAAQKKRWSEFRKTKEE